MRYHLLLVLLLVLSVGVPAQQQPAPQIPYEATTPLQMPPDLYLGEVAGVGVNSKGNIFVYTRTGSAGHIAAPRAAQLLEFDRNGKFIREIGGNLYSKAWAHAVRIDRADNIWLVDNGSSLAVKLSPEGRLLKVFGRRSESVASLHPRPPEPPGTPPPPARPGIFNEPTDVAWDPAGNAYFSDGYRNSRIAKYDKDGNWVKSWGENGSQPGQLRTPHGIATDANGNVYVADRSNSRIQVFDGDGKVLRQFTLNMPQPAGYVPNIPDFGKNSDGSWRSLFPNTVCITPPPNQVLYTQDMIPGRIYKFALDGKLLGYFGESGTKVGQFGWIHSIACPSENEIYVGELLNWRVQKLTLRPARPTSNSASR